MQGPDWVRGPRYERARCKYLHEEITGERERSVAEEAVGMSIRYRPEAIGNSVENIWHTLGSVGCAWRGPCAASTSSRWRKGRRSLWDTKTRLLIVVSWDLRYSDSYLELEPGSSVGLHDFCDITCTSSRVPTGKLSNWIEIWVSHLRQDPWVVTIGSLRHFSWKFFGMQVWGTLKIRDGRRDIRVRKLVVPGKISCFYLVALCTHRKSGKTVKRHRRKLNTIWKEVSGKILWLKELIRYKTFWGCTGRLPITSGMSLKRQTGTIFIIQLIYSEEKPYHHVRHPFLSKVT